MILADHAGKTEYCNGCDDGGFGARHGTKTKNDEHDNFITHALCINAALSRIVRILARSLIAKK
jgi:hypothetical protein